MQETKLLITVLNEVELGLITGILKENQIPFIIKDRGAGGYMRVYTGASNDATDILVKEDDLNKANDFIANFQKEENVPS